ncbi:TPA: hypothetical protein ACK2W8_004701 [Klebsiella oxytoca]
MERKFMVYQRRDGFQVAEEATGTRLENGMEFLARPHKSALWCTAEFNIVIDDDYEVVGEEFIDCSRLPTQVLCFVEGVMKIFDQSRIAIENMIEEFDDAISDRDLIVARQLKADINAAIEQCHVNALETNAEIERKREARRVADVVRAEFWLGNPVTQREDLEIAHDKAIRVNYLNNMFKNFWSLNYQARINWFNDDFDEAKKFECKINSSQQYQKLGVSDTWQTQERDNNEQEYQIYLSCADDGKGNEFMTGKPLKTYEQWLIS